jgi:hypothetical protein
LVGAWVVVWVVAWVVVWVEAWVEAWVVALAQDNLICRDENCLLYRRDQRLLMIIYIH